MLTPVGGFSGFSVVDAAEARAFYADVLGLEVLAQGYGTRVLLPGGTSVFFYPKGPGHEPATYTMLNLVVEDIDAAVDALVAAGVEIEHGEHTDDRGIQRGIASGRGPDQAWFRDPSGNILSVLVEAPGD